MATLRRLELLWRRYSALSRSSSCSASLSSGAPLLLLFTSPLANERSAFSARARRCAFLLRAGRVGVSPAWLSSKLISRTTSGLCAWKMFWRERERASWARRSAATHDKLELGITIQPQFSLRTNACAQPRGRSRTRKWCELHVALSYLFAQNAIHLARNTDLLPLVHNTGEWQHYSACIFTSHVALVVL